MGKSEKGRRSHRRRPKGREREQEAVLSERRARRRRYITVAIPLVTFAFAAAFYWGMSDTQAAGITLLLGALAFFLYGLGTLGSEVQPRERERAGSIDFGKRR